MEEQLIQSERLAATGRLAFDIAHEINNPLAGIITYVHIVMEDLPEDSPERHNMEKILKAANRCKIIVKGLLDFARSETHEKEEVEVNSLIKDSLELVEGHLFFKKVKMNLQFHPGLPLLRAVRVKLEQVFLNMIVNAAEAMQGNGELKISTSFDSDLNMLVIVFQDTGPGIEPENLAKVFEPFFTTKQRGRGTGLGLAISHGIIKQHNGAIRVRSQLGKGATFIIELPV
jgi:two-component system NtrC family sensor kinase